MKDRIRMVRDHFKLSRAAFGKQMGVSGDVINNAELGRVKPNQLLINSISSVFGVREEWLRTGEGEMFKPGPENNITLAMIGSMYESNPTIRAILDAYVELPPEQQKYFEQILDTMAQKYIEKRSE